MEPNAFATLRVPAVVEFSQFLDIPRGTLMRFGINPFNGSVVVGFQDTPAARIYIREVLTSVSSDLEGMFESHRRKSAFIPLTDLVGDRG